MTEFLTKEERIERDRNLKVTNIPIGKIKDNPFQSRKKYPREGIKRLALSISNRGLMNPLSVVGVDDYFVLVGGHRRLRALKSLKRKSAPCIIRRRSTVDNLALDLAIENAQRKELAPIEKARDIFNVLSTRIPNIKAGRSPEDMKIHAEDVLRAMMVINQIKLSRKRGEIGANFVGKHGFEAGDVRKCEKALELLDISVNTALTYLRMFDLPVFIRDKIVAFDNDCSRDTKNGLISVRMAYELTRVKSNKIRKKLYKRVTEDGLSYINTKFVIDKILEEGEEGFASRGTNQKRDVDDYGLALLIKKNFSMASFVWNWRTHKLPLVHSYLKNSFDEIEARASLERLLKSCLYLADAVSKLLYGVDQRKKIDLINRDLRILITPGSRPGDKCRFSFPRKIAVELGVEAGDQIELKICRVIKKSCNTQGGGL